MLFAPIDPAERAVVAHVRGDRHDSSACPLCKALYAQHVAEVRLDSVITGTPLPEWVSQS